MPELESRKKLGLDVYNTDLDVSFTKFLSYFLGARFGRHRVTESPDAGVQVAELSLRQNQPGERDEIALFEVEPTRVRLINIKATIRVVTTDGNYFEHLQNHGHGLELRNGDIISINSAVFVVHPPQHPKQRLSRPAIDPRKLKIYDYNVTEEQVKLQHMEEAVEKYTVVPAVPTMAASPDNFKGASASSMFGDSTGPIPATDVVANHQTRVSKTSTSVAADSQEPTALRVHDIAPSQILNAIDHAMDFLTEDPAAAEILPPITSATRHARRHVGRVSSPIPQLEVALDAVGARDQGREDEESISAQEFDPDHGEDETASPIASQAEDEMEKQPVFNTPSMCPATSDQKPQSSESSGPRRGNAVSATSSSNSSLEIFGQMAGEDDDISEVETDVDGYESDAPAKDKGKALHTTADENANAISKLDDPLGGGRSADTDQSVIQAASSADVAGQADLEAVDIFDFAAQKTSSYGVGTNVEVSPSLKSSEKRKVLADITSDAAQPSASKTNKKPKLAAETSPIEEATEQSPKKLKHPRKTARKSELDEEASPDEDNLLQAVEQSPKKLNRPTKPYSDATTEVLAQRASGKKRKRSTKVKKSAESDTDVKFQARPEKTRTPLSAIKAGEAKITTPTLTKKRATSADIVSTQDTIELAYGHDDKDEQDSYYELPLPAENKRRIVKQSAENSLEDAETDESMQRPKTLKSRAKTPAKVTTKVAKKNYIYSKDNSRSSLRSSKTDEDSTVKLMPAGSKYAIAFASNVNTGALLGKRSLSVLGLSQVNDVLNCDVFVVKAGVIIRSPRLLLAVALGKDIVTDKWVETAFKIGKLLHFDDYLASDPKQASEWGTTLQEAMQRYRADAKPFKEIGILLSTQYQKALSSETTAGLRQLLRACGATGLWTKNPKKSLRDQMIMVGMGDQKDIAEAEKLSYRLYNKDMISLVVLRGEFDLDDAQYLVHAGDESEIEQEEEPQAKRKKA